MDYIRDFLDSMFYGIEFQNIWISIGLIILFKIMSIPFAYIIVKMFNFKVKDKKKIRKNSFYKPLKLFFLLLRNIPCVICS